MQYMIRNILCKKTDIYIFNKYINTNNYKYKVGVEDYSARIKVIYKIQVLILNNSKVKSAVKMEISM